MCKSLAEGGQRCATVALARLNAVSERGSAWDARAVEYAATPKGHIDLTERRDLALTSGDHMKAGRLDSALRAGRSRREANQTAAASIAALRTAPSFKHQPGGFCDLGPEIDLRDAEACHLALKAAALVRDDYPKADKQAREAISHYWQYPRIPPGRMIASQYPETLLWSPEAKSLWDDAHVNKYGAKEGLTGKHLRLEHLVPQSLLTAELFKNLEDHSPETLAARLRLHNETGFMVVITKAESATVDSKWQNTTPDLSDPWKRYADIGVTQADCVQPDPTGCKCI